MIDWPVSTEDPTADLWDAAVTGTAEREGVGAPAPEGWREWLETLFPVHVRWGFAPHHEEMWEWAYALDADSSPEPFVSILARGGAKSSSAELIVCNTGVRETRRYCVYIRETQEMADKSVGNVAALLESQAIATYYPKHAEKSVNKFGSSKGWRRNRLVTAGGFVVDALGLDTAARGIKFEEQRPDLIVLDDIDGKHDTLATTLRKISTITTSILPAGAWNVAVLAVQNLIIPDGVFTRMVDGRADYLARRTVSGPHPAVINLKWEYREQGEGKPRRAVVTGGTPTWDGQNLSVVQHQIDLWGIGAFLIEAQHEVHRAREGLVLKYEPARHDETLTDDDAWSLIALGSVIAGVDFQRWRFGFVLDAVDREGVVHQIAEYFSQNEDLEPRARVIHALCTHYRCPPKLRIWGDSANPTDIAEINRSFRTIGSPFRVVPVGREGKLRGAFVERANNELGRNALKLRRDVGEWCWRALREQWRLLGYEKLPNEDEREPPDVRRWMLGQNVESRGTEVYGSRHKYEVQHWSYPVPAPGETQGSDPDDDTADGADLIAARRYSLMSWWKPAKQEEEKPVRDPNVDTGLEKLLERRRNESGASWGQRPKLERRRVTKREEPPTPAVVTVTPMEPAADAPDYGAGIAALLSQVKR